MAELDSCLTEAERVFRQMQSLAASGDEDGKREVVRLRSRYAMLMLDLRQARKGDTRLQSNPALAQEFDRRIGQVGKLLAEHQSKWRVDAIEGDPAGYLESARKLSSAQDEFYTWVRSDLKPT